MRVNSRGKEDSLSDECGDEAKKDRKHPRREKRARNFEARISGTAFKSKSY
jgi:hypothetical protein